MTLVRAKNVADGASFQPGSRFRVHLNSRTMMCYGILGFCQPFWIKLASYRHQRRDNGSPVWLWRHLSSASTNRNICIELRSASNALKETLHHDFDLWKKPQLMVGSLLKQTTSEKQVVTTVSLEVQNHFVYVMCMDRTRTKVATIFFVVM